MPSPLPGERDQLNAYLAHQRYLVRTMVHGLTDAQARSAPSASTLSPGGLVKHLSMTERSWTARVTGAPQAGGAEAYMAGFVMTDDETLEALLADYGAACGETDSTLADFDLDHAVPVGPEPWFPKDVTSWSVRWVLLHLIEETARHVGHLDIIRESTDGATWYPLMAAVDGVSPAPWVQPWRPPGGGARPAGS